jgi:Sec23/Sec24 trunk domain
VNFFDVSGFLMSFPTAPQCQSYNNLGQECVGAGCSVDLFVMNNSYVDIATIGQVSRLTGGEVYKYTYFQVRKVAIFQITRAKRPIFVDRLTLMAPDWSKT